MEQVHPVLARLRGIGKTQSWLAALVNDQGTKLSRPHLCDILSGRRRPSPTLAEAIARALGGEPTPAAIVFWRPLPTAEVAVSPGEPSAA